MLPNDSPGLPDHARGGRTFEIHAHAAAFYVALLKAGLSDEATEFAEWYLDTFDHDLET